MDKIIEKKTGLAAAFTKRAVKYWAGAALAIILIVLMSMLITLTLLIRWFG